MTINIQETQAIVDRWRPEYVERAAHVESELTQLFQEAVTTEEPHDLLEHGGVSKSLPYIAMRSEEFEHRIVLKILPLKIMRFSYHHLFKLFQVRGARLLWFSLAQGPRDKFYLLVFAYLVAVRYYRVSP